jgi:hypothetical protein
MTMGQRMPDQETLLEIGVAVVGSLLLGGLAILLFGRAAGGMRRSQRHAQAPPSPGEVPAERHQHTASVSAR